MTELKSTFDNAYEAVDDLFNELLNAIKYADEINMSAEVQRGLRTALNDISMMIHNNLTDDGKVATHIHKYLEGIRKVKK